MAIHRLDAGIITRRFNDAMARLGPLDVPMKASLVALSIFALMLAAIILQVRPLISRVTKQDPETSPAPSNVNPVPKADSHEDSWKHIEDGYNALVDDFFKNKKLSENLVKPLEEKIKSFQDSFSNQTCFPSYGVSIGTIGKTINTLRIEGEHPFIDIRKSGYVIDQRDIVLVPEDGNCLYYAVAAHLKLIGSCEVSHEQLRTSAVQWMKENAEESQLKAIFYDTIEYFRQKETSVLGNLIAGAENEPDKKKAYQEDLEMVTNIQTVQDYCAYAAKPNKFATLMEILALSALYGTPIRIFVFKEKKFQHAYPVINEDTYPKDKLLTLVFEDECHYNFKFPSKD